MRLPVLKYFELDCFMYLSCDVYEFFINERKVGILEWITFDLLVFFSFLVSIMY